MIVKHTCIIGTCPRKSLKSRNNRHMVKEMGAILAN